MPVGTNPFGDGVYDGGGGGVAMNPFGDDDRGGGGTNPFDNDDGDDRRGAGGAGMKPFDGGGGPAAFGMGPAAEEDDWGGGNGNGADPSVAAELADPNAPVEASWQFLGDLPYRRVVMYDGIEWGRGPSGGKDGPEEAGGGVGTDGTLGGFGLAAFPPRYLEAYARRAAAGESILDESDFRRLLKTATVTRVAGCPNGGPVAAITLPVAGTSLPGFGSVTSDKGARGASDATSALSTTQLRIMSSSGRTIASVDFPPPSLALTYRRTYTAADVLEIGFTDRCVLLVVMRDSLILTYDMQGKQVLPPFHSLPKGDDPDAKVQGPPSGRGGMGRELMQATVYGGGCAVLSTSMDSAVVEMLDWHDDPEYLEGAALEARRIVPEDDSSGPALAAVGIDGIFGTARSGPLPRHVALVTPLATAVHSSRNYYSYCTVAVLPRAHTESRRPEVFLSTSDNSVVIADTAGGGITDVDCRGRVDSPIVAMSFAPNGRFLACFTRGCILLVISTNFETKVLDFDTSVGSRDSPSEMEWCGEDSVVLHWKNLGVLMVGPYGDWLRFPYDQIESLHILPEIDCCRIVTASTMELLQRIPPATAQLLRIGSIEPSAMLLDASDDFVKGDPSSDESARAIMKTGMLDEAIDICTDAATKEFDVPTQKRLLQAASYGMHFCYRDPQDQSIMGGPIVYDEDDEEKPDSSIRPSLSAVKFVTSSQKLRILNALRHPDVGLMLTLAQFDSVTPAGVVARLVAMKRPALAGAISNYLNLENSVKAFARASRAAALIASDGGRRTDSATAEAVVKILNEDDETAGASRGTFAPVALSANKAGRPGVAQLLLMLETSVADKVPALLSIGSFADAAAVATTAMDSDLIFLCLVEFLSSCESKAAAAQVGPGGDATKDLWNRFFSTVVTKFPPEAANLLRRYYASNPDVKKVMNLMLRNHKFKQAGTIMARRAMEPPSKSNKDGQERVAMLKEACRVFGLGKEAAFHKTSTDDYLDLLSEQKRLRKGYDSPDVAPDSTSVTSTIFSVVRYAGQRPREAHRLFADAERLAKKFRVSEKRLWHVKVRAFAESGQWANLRNLSDSRAKPPIGFKPFALAAIKGQQGVGEVMRYIDRIASTEDRYDLFCEAGLWKRALEEATKLQDGRRIMHVRSSSTSQEVQQLCNELVGRMGS